MINFRLNCAHDTPFHFAPTEPSRLERLDRRQRQLAIRFDDLAHLLGLPHDWSPAERDMGVLIVLSQDKLDLEIVQWVRTSYEHSVHGWRDAKDMDGDLLRRLERDIAVCEGNFTEDMGHEHTHWRADIQRCVRGLDYAWRGLGRSTFEGGLLGGCPGLEFDGWSIVRDALSIGGANWFGYVLGTAAQTAIEHAFCDEGGDLPYEKRLAAELLNRVVQHGVRFALRDVAIPAIKQCLGLKTLSAPMRIHLWILMLVPVFCAFDQLGLVLSSQLPSVQRSGRRELPDVWDNGLQTGIFAVTDVLAWLTIGCLSQLLFKSRYQNDPDPFISLRIKGLTQGCQALGEGLALSAWKHHAQHGLSPDNLCSRGSGSVEFHSFVALFDGIELGTFWLITAIVGCMGRQELEPLPGVVEHSVSNRPVSHRRNGNGSQAHEGRDVSSGHVSGVPRPPTGLSVAGTELVQLMEPQGSDHDQAPRDIGGGSNEADVDVGEEAGEIAQEGGEITDNVTRHVLQVRAFEPGLFRIGEAGDPRWRPRRSRSASWP